MSSENNNNEQEKTPPSILETEKEQTVTTEQTIENILYELHKKAHECYEKKDYEQAISYYQEYIKLNPNNPFIYNTLGFLYKKHDENNTIEKRIECYEKAVEINPDYTPALRNLALTYQLVEKYNEGIECFERVLKLDAVTDDYYAYACQKLRLKDFEKGWEAYGYRFLKGYGPTPYITTNKPFWEGESHPDKTLLVQSEQGFGDSLQFIRYIDLAKPFFNKIIFRVQDDLADLFEINTDIEIIKNSVPIDEINFDYHVPLMNLLKIFKATDKNVPKPEGYINADPKQVEKYKNDFFDNNCLKIGISWHGNVTGRQSRNIPLHHFYALARLKNVKVYSFQKPFSKREYENLPPNIKIVDLGKTFNDFSDTAAAMTNIDVMITSDNSILNLAGSMSKKTFLLLNKLSEWRWFFDDDKTPWYSSVKILKKQNENDSWSTLMHEVINSLDL